MNVILDIWTGFIKLLVHLDNKINGADTSQFQDCFIKVKIVDFFLEAVWNWKKNWQSKSLFLAFTISTEVDGRIVRVWKTDRGLFVLDFEFSEKEKSFRNQIGSVSRWNFRRYQWSFCKKWSRDRLCRISFFIRLLS